MILHLAINIPGEFEGAAPPHPNTIVEFEGAAPPHSKTLAEFEGAEPPHPAPHTPKVSTQKGASHEIS